MTKLNKTNLGFGGDGQVSVTYSDIGKWGAPTGASHHRFVNFGTGGDKMLYGGPFYESTYGQGGYYNYTDTAASDLWKHNGVADCEGATNDGSIPGPTLGSKFTWKLWLTDQGLLNAIDSNQWENPQWVVELTSVGHSEAEGDSRDATIINWEWHPAHHCLYLNTLEPESDADGRTEDGERCIAVDIITNWWYENPLTRHWGLFSTPPKINIKLWQVPPGADVDLPYVNNSATADEAQAKLAAAIANVQTPSHEETITLRDHVFPNLLIAHRDSQTGPVIGKIANSVGADEELSDLLNINYPNGIIEPGNTYHIQSRYFGPDPGVAAGWKVGGLVEMAPLGGVIPAHMDKYWIIDSGILGNIDYVTTDSHIWEWDLHTHSTIYPGVNGARSYEWVEWTLPQLSGNLTLDWKIGATKYWIDFRAGTVDPADQTLKGFTGDNRPRKGETNTDYTVLSESPQSVDCETVTDRQVLDLTSIPAYLSVEGWGDHAGEVEFDEGDTTQLKLRFKHLYRDIDGDGVDWQDLRLSYLDGFSAIDLDMTAMNQAFIDLYGDLPHNDDQAQKRWQRTSLYVEGYVRRDSLQIETVLGDDIAYYVTPPISFVEDYIPIERITDGVFYGNELFDIRFVGIDRNDVTSPDILVSSGDATQNISITQEVDLGHVMPAAAYDLNVGDSVKSILMPLGIVMSYGFTYVGLSENLSAEGAVIQSLVKDNKIRYSIKTPSTTNTRTYPFSYNQVVQPGSTTSLWFYNDANLAEDGEAIPQVLAPVKGLYDWHGTTNLDELYLVVETPISPGSGSYEVIGVWHVEPLWPEYSGTLMDGTTDENALVDTRPVIPEADNSNYTIEVTWKRKNDTEDPSFYTNTDIINYTVQGSFSANDISIYLNEPTQNLDHPKVSAEDFAGSFPNYNTTDSGNTYLYYNPQSVTRNQSSVTWEIKPSSVFKSDTDLIEGWETLVQHVEWNYADKTNNNHVSYNSDGEEEDPRVLNVSDAEKLSLFNVTLERLETQADIPDPWPHSGQNPPHPDLKNQIYPVGTLRAYTGQGMKLTVDASDPGIAVGQAVQVEIFLPSNPDIGSGSAEQDMSTGLWTVTKTFTKMPGFEVWTEYFRVDLDGSQTAKEVVYSFKAGLVNRMPGSPLIVDSSIRLINASAYPAWFVIREVGGSGYVVESDMPYNYSESNIEDDLPPGTDLYLSTYFKWRDVIETPPGSLTLGDGFTELPFGQAQNSQIPVFIVLEDANGFNKEFTITQFGYQNDGIATIGGKTGLLQTIERGISHTNSANEGHPETSLLDEWFATISFSFTSDADGDVSMLKATVYVGIDSDSTSLDSAIATYSKDLITLTDETPNYVSLSIGDGAVDHEFLAADPVLNFTNTTAEARYFSVSVLSHRNEWILLNIEVVVGAGGTFAQAIPIRANVTDKSKYPVSAGKGDNNTIAITVLGGTTDGFPTGYTTPAQLRTGEDTGDDVVYQNLNNITYRSGYFSWNDSDRDIEEYPDFIKSGVTNTVYINEALTNNSDDGDISVYFNTHGYDFGPLQLGRDEMPSVDGLFLAALGNQSYNSFYDWYRWTNATAQPWDTAWVSKPYVGSKDDNTDIDFSSRGIVLGRTATSLPSDFFWLDGDGNIKQSSDIIEVETADDTAQLQLPFGFVVTNNQPTYTTTAELPQYRVKLIEIDPSPITGPPDDDTVIHNGPVSGYRNINVSWSKGPLEYSDLGVISDNPNSIVEYPHQYCTYANSDDWLVGGTNGATFQFSVERWSPDFQVPATGWFAVYTSPVYQIVHPPQNNTTLTSGSHEVVFGDTTIDNAEPQAMYATTSGPYNTYYEAWMHYEKITVQELAQVLIDNGVASSTGVDPIGDVVALIKSGTHTIKFTGYKIYFQGINNSTTAITSSNGAKNWQVQMGHLQPNVDFSVNRDWENVENQLSGGFTNVVNLSAWYRIDGSNEGWRTITFDNDFTWNGDDILFHHLADEQNNDWGNGYTAPTHKVLNYGTTYKVFAYHLKKDNLNSIKDTHVNTNLVRLSYRTNYTFLITIT